MIAMHEIKCGKVSVVKIIKEKNIVVKKFSRKSDGSSDKTQLQRVSRKLFYERAMLQALRITKTFPISLILMRLG